MAKFLIVAALIGILNCSLPAFAESNDSNTSCDETLTPDSDGNSIVTMIPELENQVQIIWYPRSKWGGITHVDLNVGEDVWGTHVAFEKKGSYTASKRAANSGGFGFVAFHVKVTDSEFKKINNYLRTAEGKDLRQNCISGACRAITLNSGVRIPSPFSNVPTLAAIYLTLSSKMGYERITRIEWVGKSQRNFGLGVAPFVELFSFFYIGKIAIGLLFTGIDHAQNWIQNFVPIFSGL